MVADLLRYSPGQNLAEAVAFGGNRVRFLSLERPEPVSAERLRWDLATGRVEVLRPGVVGLPE
jgi:hypothetical protein